MAVDDGASRERSPGPGLWEAVRRNPRTVVTAVVVGLILGGVFTLVRGETYTAETQVMVGENGQVAIFREPPSLNPDARSNAAAIAMRTHTVTDRASELLGGDVSGGEIRRQTVIAPVLGSAVVTIEATTDDAERSAQIANAVARAYNEHSAALARQVGKRTQKELTAQRQRLSKEMDKLQAARSKRVEEVAASFAGYALEDQDRLTFAALQSDVAYESYGRRLDNLSEAMEAIRNSQAQSRVDTNLVTGGVNTVYKAATPKSRFFSSLVLKMAVGGLLGLVAGVVLAWRRLDRGEPAEEAERSSEATRPLVGPVTGLSARTRSGEQVAGGQGTSRDKTADQEEAGEPTPLRRRG